MTKKHWTKSKEIKFGVFALLTALGSAAVAFDGTLKSVVNELGVAAGALAWMWLRAFWTGEPITETARKRTVADKVKRAAKGE